MGYKAGYRVTLYVLPFTLDVDGCEVTIIEVTKLKTPQKHYLASLTVKCGDAQSRVFHLTFKNSKELKFKIITEVSKLKYFLILYGKEGLKKLGIVT